MAHATSFSTRTWRTPFIGFVLLAFDLPAQSLGPQDLLPAIGATWHMRALQTVPAEEIPIDPIIWPYSDLVGNDLYGTTYTVLDPSQVSGSSVYAGADRVVRSVPDNDPAPTHTFLDIQEDECLELGAMGPVLTTNFDPGAMVLAFPLALGEVVTGSFCYTSRSTGGVLDYCGTTRIALEAVGTLELAMGIFQNVQQVSARRATAIAGGADSSIYTMKDWYAPGIPFPLLRFTTLVGPDGSTTRTGQVLDENSLVGLTEPIRPGTLTAFPNPTNGSLIVATEGAGTLEVMGADGRSLRTHRILAPALGNTTLDLSDLPEGLYHIAYRDAYTTRTTQVVVLH